MKKIEDGAAFFFIIAVTILSGVSILGIWDFFSDDVITKSFQTLGLLAVVAVIILVAGKFMEKRSADGADVPVVPDPAFKSIRQIAVVILIVSASFLAILGVLSIWEIITDKDVLNKAISSIGVLTFSAFVIVLTSLEREGNPLLHREGKRMSVGGIVLILFIAYMILSFGRLLFY